MATGHFICQEIVGLIFLDRSTEGGPSLHSSVSRIRYGAKRVDRLEFPVAQKSENVAVEIIRSTLGNDVHDTAGGAPVFRRVAVNDHLEFLRGILRDGRTDPIYRIVSGICTVH